MEVSPKKIQLEFQNKNLDKKSASELLFSLIENSDDDEIRVESVQVLQNLSAFNNNTFTFLEHLFVSDSSEKVRAAAAKVIETDFLEKALTPMQWALVHEDDYECIITIIETLAKINNEKSKSILIKELKKIEKLKYLDESKQYVNKFKKVLKKAFSIKKFKDFTQKELADLLINYRTISNLLKTLNVVYFELEDGLVVNLDVSNAFEVRGMPGYWINNIRSLSQIKGLKNLTHLKELNLINNQIEDLKEIADLKCLTHLYISNNKIDAPKNIDYLKEIPSLRYVDLGGNEIVKKINPHEFNFLEINTRNQYF